MEDHPLSAIPASAAPFFQEYRFAELDAEADRLLIIKRLLAFGDRHEARWLFQRYGRVEILTWVEQYGRQRLPSKRHTSFCVLLDLPLAETPEPTEPRIWKP